MKVIAVVIEKKVTGTCPLQIIIGIKNISGGNLRFFNVSARNKTSKVAFILLSSSYIPLNIK